VDFGQSWNTELPTQIPKPWQRRLGWLGCNGASPVFGTAQFEVYWGYVEPYQDPGGEFARLGLALQLLVAFFTWRLTHKRAYRRPAARRRRNSMPSNSRKHQVRTLVIRVLLSSVLLLTTCRRSARAKSPWTAVWGPGGRLAGPNYRIGTDLGQSPAAICFTAWQSNVQTERVRALPAPTPSLISWAG